MLGKGKSIGIGNPRNNDVLVSKENKVNISIPDNDSDGISHAILVKQEGFISDIIVSTEIQHTYKKDLRIKLKSPTGNEIILLDSSNNYNINSSNEKIVFKINKFSPKLYDLLGTNMQGEWKISVVDAVNLDAGTLNKWSLKIKGKNEKLRRVKKKINPNTTIPDADYHGIQSEINYDEPGKIINLKLNFNITHTYRGDLKVILVTPEQEEIVLHNREGRGFHNIQKQYFASDTEGPLKNIIGKNSNGTWKLKVADYAEEDVGMLNAWSLDIVYYHL